MGLNITKKIIKSHLVEGSMESTGQICVSVDQTLGHDLTGIMASQIRESIGADKVTTDASVYYCDHNTIAASMENSDDHVYLKTSAQK